MKKTLSLLMTIFLPMLLSFIMFWLALFLSTNQVNAFWQSQTNSVDLTFIAGDWRPPASEIKLMQNGQTYQVGELLTQNCQGKQMSLADLSNITCQLDFHQHDPAQLIYFQSKNEANNPALFNQPDFQLARSDNRQQWTGFWSSGVSPNAPNQQWQSHWLPLKSIAQNQNKFKLRFSASPTQVTNEQVASAKVVIKNLTTLALVVTNNDKLHFKASEPVNWQITYRLSGQIRNLHLSGQEAELKLADIDPQADPHSWQIQAIDLAGNEGQLIKPIIYFDQSHSIQITHFHFQRSKTNKLTLGFDITDQAIPEQVKNFFLETDQVDTKTIIELKKVTPFISFDNQLSKIGERVVLTTTTTITNKNFCLYARSILNEPIKLECFSS